MTPTPVILYPFSHRFTIANCSIVCGEVVKSKELKRKSYPKIFTRMQVDGWPESGYGKILLYFYPKGSEVDKESVGIVASWRYNTYKAWMKVSILDANNVQVYSKSKLCGENSGVYMPHFISRSTLLSNSASLLPQDELTLCFEGVTWYEEVKFEPEKNMDLVNAAISSAPTTTSRFHFRLSSYRSHKWVIPKLSKYLSSKNSGALYDNFQLDEQTKFCLELDHYKDDVSRKGDKELSCHLQLLECNKPQDRISVCYYMALLDKDGKTYTTDCEVEVVRKNMKIGMNRFISLNELSYFNYKLLPSETYTIFVEVAVIEDDNINENNNPEDLAVWEVSRDTKWSYRDLFQHLDFSQYWASRITA